MRKIVFLQQNAGEFSESILALCSSFTPLVEPLEKSQLYLDISGCGPAGKLLAGIAAAVYQESSLKLEIGLASSKLLAYLAVTRQQLPPETLIAPSYRCLESPETRLVQVLPGHEASFLAAIPLQGFPPLSPSDAMKLTRIGLTTVGDINALSLPQLQSLLTKNAYTIYEKSRGVDKTPVIGLYPPEHIVYPLDFGTGCADLLLMEEQIKLASYSLESILTQRDCGFSFLRLELQTEKRQLEIQRQLGTLCHRAESLQNITIQLLRKANIREALQSCIIKIYEISPLNWKEQDLFTSRAVYQAQEKQLQVDSLFSNLEHQFPGILLRGQQINRREQILSLWDPWRQGW